MSRYEHSMATRGVDGAIEFCRTERFGSVPDVVLLEPDRFADVVRDITWTDRDASEAFERGTIRHPRGPKIMRAEVRKGIVICLTAGLVQSLDLEGCTQPPITASA